MISRLNKNCGYFPCHEGLGDCTFCYCPFYPCGDKHKGRYVVTKDNRNIWSCKDCNWIHKKKVVDKIFRMLRRDNIKTRQIISNLKGGAIGVVVLGHGSKIKRANDTVRRVAEEIKKRGGLGIVEPAYLQLCRPDLKKVIKKIVKRGCRKVIVVPFFLFMGNHVSRDIPNAIKQEAKQYREVEFIYSKNLGQDPRISDIVMDCIREAAE